MGSFDEDELLKKMSCVDSEIADLANTPSVDKYKGKYNKKFMVSRSVNESGPRSTTHQSVLTSQFQILELGTSHAICMVERRNR